MENVFLVNIKRLARALSRGLVRALVAQVAQVVVAVASVADRVVVVVHQGVGKL